MNLKVLLLYSSIFEVLKEIIHDLVCTGADTGSPSVCVVVFGIAFPAALAA